MFGRDHFGCTVDNGPEAARGEAKIQVRNPSQAQADGGLDHGCKTQQDLGDGWMMG